MQPEQRTTHHTPQSIVYNGYEYKSLANHDPHSTVVIDEWNKLYSMDAHWQLCPNTPDALHVCKTCVPPHPALRFCNNLNMYPWAARALVLADGSAYYTALAPSANASLQPGAGGNMNECNRAHDDACRNRSALIWMPETGGRAIRK